MHCRFEHAGLRVIELAGIGPGSHACMLLADLVADVVRIERPRRPDAPDSDMATAITDALNELAVLGSLTAEVVARVLAADAGPHTLVPRGARDYLSTHDVVLIECGDLATGADIDRPRAHRQRHP